MATIRSASKLTFGLACVLLAACAPTPQTLQRPPLPTNAAPAQTVAAQPTQAATIRATAAPSATIQPPTAAPIATNQPASTALPPTALPPTAPLPASTTQPVATGNEIMFLREGVLTALNVSGGERTIVEDVQDFATTPDGSLIVLVRGVGRDANIWTVRSDGSGLTQHTDDDRVDATPVLAADGSAVVFASATTDEAYTRSWPEWGQWCATSEAKLLELASGEVRTLGAGCDPAIAPDGKRIAYATPPTGAMDGFPNSLANTIRLVNRQGQNGWSLATADGGLSGNQTRASMLVYGPAWSADGARVAYHRFLGYQVLVDMGMSEVSPVFRADGKPVYSGAGWQLPAHFAPNASTVAITEDNYSDARGFGGYDNWSVTVVSLSGSREVAMPEGAMTLVGSNAETLARAQGGTWSPDGTSLAVILPPGWTPDLPANEPVNNGAEEPGELWLWVPGQTPKQRLATNIDFASPVVWLP